MSSNTSSVDQSVLGLTLPAGGHQVPDYIVGGIYGFFSSIVLYIAWKNFGRKKPIGSAYINLHFFAVARCVGYILRGVTDGMTPTADWNKDQWTTYVSMLTSAYSIITAGTTLFLFFMSIVSVHFRRTCEAASPRESTGAEERRQKSEGTFLWIFRIFVIALAAVAAVGSVREFNPYWFNYNQGKLMREIVAVVQIALTVCMVAYVTSTYIAHHSPGRCTRAYFVVNAIFILMLITQAYSILRVVSPLTSKINANPNFSYFLQVIPELLLLSLVLVSRLDWALDYTGIQAEQYPPGWIKH
ncbi:hypothetical protein BOTBODRAFT_51342 [Botryobasidium botryosum FD-172 SS1]|uniref:THH1/TOM1/TOM3 domain-containing protein n=1 Tax=Botryobasidium botryosum (strain FD-172 SS1) TaxID=930990 RepID=A0A067N887_BOTB1|nr:hypothetical protein BOTBODRAFT_51342 [Botryobasidium botryosum FD-172 SS1]